MPAFPWIASVWQSFPSDGEGGGGGRGVFTIDIAEEWKICYLSRAGAKGCVIIVLQYLPLVRQNTHNFRDGPSEAKMI